MITKGKNAMRRESTLDWVRKVLSEEVTPPGDLEGYHESSWKKSVLTKGAAHTKGLREEGAWQFIGTAGSQRIRERVAQDQMQS